METYESALNNKKLNLSCHLYSFWFIYAKELFTATKSKPGNSNETISRTRKKIVQKFNYLLNSIVRLSTLIRKTTSHWRGTHIPRYISAAWFKTKYILYFMCVMCIACECGCTCCHNQKWNYIRFIEHTNIYTLKHDIFSVICLHSFYSIQPKSKIENQKLIVAQTCISLMLKR